LLNEMNRLIREWQLDLDAIKASKSYLFMNYRSSNFYRHKTIRSILTRPINTNSSVTF
jgi:hypothetical protein